jgi:cyanate lyase
MSPVMITGGVLGQQKMTKPMATKAAKLFGLSASEQALLNAVRMRGAGTVTPTDPLIYRLRERNCQRRPPLETLVPGITSR